jgi:hypothetical protein
MDIIERLSAPFPPDAISWRVGSTTQDKSKGMALAYIDARDAQDRLNEVCGPFGWQCRHEVSQDKRVTCHVGVRSPETGEWVWKSDGAGETDYEGEKGSYSDSFKRACVKWGIGRYLYDCDSPWVAIEQKGKTFVIPPQSAAILTKKLQAWQASYFRDKGNVQPFANPKVRPTDGAWDGFNEEDTAYLRGQADKAASAYEAGDIAKAHDIYTQGASGGGHSSEERIAIWSLFPSQMRTALTKFHKSQEKKAA